MEMRKLAVSMFARLTVSAIKIQTLSIINTRESGHLHTLLAVCVDSTFSSSIAIVAQSRH